MFSKRSSFLSIETSRVQESRGVDNTMMMRKSVDVDLRSAEYLDQRKMSVSSP
jgi:hypothetical protein